MYNIWLKQVDPHVSNSYIESFYLHVTFKRIYCFLHFVLIFFTPQPTQSNLTLRNKAFYLNIFSTTVISFPKRCV